MRATLEIKYADHTYKATVFKTADLADYLRREKRAYELGELAVREACSMESARESKALRSLVRCIKSGLIKL